MTQRECEVMRKLRDALEDLMDVQNGPPLIELTKDWNESMDRAGRAVDAAKALLEK